MTDDHRAADVGHAAEPDDVSDAQAAVELSRERISDTLGDIEDHLLDRKQAWQAKVDVLRPVRDRVQRQPWVMVAAAAGAGAVFGALIRPRRRRGAADTAHAAGLGKAALRLVRRQLMIVLAGAITDAVRRRVLTERSAPRSV